MKKLFSLFAVLCTAATMWANGTLIDGIYYILAGDSAAVTYMGPDYWRDNDYVDAITIPSSVTCSGTTYRVTSVGEFAFYGCQGLSSITLPSSVTSIDKDAFFGCIGLSSVSIPSSVTRLGDYAFGNCNALTSMTLSDSVVSVGSAAFHGCSSLTSPLYNQRIFAYLPASYSGAYTIPSGIETIAGSAFADCEDLSSVTIPTSVTSIGESAFSFCTGLSTITIPSSITEIGNGAFVYCIGLTSITCEATTPPALSEDVFADVDTSIPLYVPAASVSLYQAADQWKDFNIQGVATSLDAISSPSETQTKLLLNGRLYLRHNSSLFDLCGHKVK